MSHRFTVIATTLVAVLGLAAVAVAKVPQGDWPPIDSQTWVNESDRSGVHHGTDRNDKLLGGHGNDIIVGHRGSDVIWGDYVSRTSGPHVKRRHCEKISHKSARDAG